jgi:hypothetical protein
MTSLDRSHPPCSYCWDGAQSPPWWCDPCIWVSWREWWCSVAGCGAPSWYCAPPWLTIPDVLDGYVTVAPSTWCQLNGPSARCRLGCIHRRCCILLDWPKETRYFPGRQAHRLDVVLSQHPANAVEYRPNIGHESDWIRLSISLAYPQGRVEGPANLPLGAAVLPENITQEHQLCMKAVMVAQSPGSVYQCGKNMNS